MSASLGKRPIIALPRNDAMCQKQTNGGAANCSYLITSSAATTVYRAVSSSEAGKFVGSLRKPLVILGHPQNIVPIKGAGLLRERAHLFSACAPIGGIVQMGMISHSHLCGADRRSNISGLAAQFHS